RAARLSAQYLGGRSVPASVAWSSRQGKRWGSCTTIDRTIRISDRVQGSPRGARARGFRDGSAHALAGGEDGPGDNGPPGREDEDEPMGQVPPGRLF